MHISFWVLRSRPVRILLVGAPSWAVNLNKAKYAICLGYWLAGLAEQTLISVGGIVEGITSRMCLAHPTVDRQMRLGYDGWELVEAFIVKYSEIRPRDPVPHAITRIARITSVLIFFG